MACTTEAILFKFKASYLLFHPLDTLVHFWFLVRSFCASVQCTENIVSACWCVGSASVEKWSSRR